MTSFHLVYAFYFFCCGKTLLSEKTWDFVPDHVAFISRHWSIRHVFSDAWGRRGPILCGVVLQTELEAVRWLASLICSGWSIIWSWPVSLPSSYWWISAERRTRTRRSLTSTQDQRTFYNVRFFCLTSACVWFDFILRMDFHQVPSCSCLVKLTCYELLPDVSVSVAELKEVELALGQSVITGCI